MKYIKILFLLFLPAVVMYGCEKLVPEAIDPEETLAEPLEGLTGAQLALHMEGDEQFAKIFSVSEGLGPVFVQAACQSCHPSDGKGNPFNNLTRFGRYDSAGNWDAMLAFGGPQLQHRAIAGFEPEVIPQGAASSKFIAPNASGLGFLEAVDDADILAMSDINDSDGDGISGVPQWVNPPLFFYPRPSSISNNGKFIGRFGRKASALNLLMQTVGAYKEDIGITSEYNAEDPVNHLVSSGNSDNVADPEISSATVKAVAFYLRTLKAPPRRNAGDADVIAGQSLFVQAGCEACHKQTLTTGNSEIAPLNHATFHPYTDLLLHDMGAELDDSYTENMALTSEWRTTPLWGLGLQENSQGGQMFLLHDGRAGTFEEAIEYHGGEAAASRTNFRNLSPGEKMQVIKFLESL